MTLVRRSALAFALATLSAVLCPRPARAATIEVYPGPGVDTYKSDLYSVEVSSDGVSWTPAYVYKFSRSSRCHWHFGTNPSVSFVTFGTDGPVSVRVSRVGGAITALDVSPHSKHIAGSVSAGQATGTMQPDDKLWLTIDGDDANPLFLFADYLKPTVPPGATYFGPGVQDIAPAASNHYKASTGEAIYLDGGAWVRGNIDVRNTHNVRIMGPGVLSGDLWSGENQGAGALPYLEAQNFAMIQGNQAGHEGASVRGITIVDSPTFNIFHGAELAEGVKILSPWWFSTDGFPGVAHVDRCFIFNGDNSFQVESGATPQDDLTVTHCFGGTANNSVFTGGYWGFESRPGYTAFVDDVDIKTYEDGRWFTSPDTELAAGVSVFVDNSDPSKGYSNQTYQNVRIEGSIDVPLLILRNLVYMFDPKHSANPPLGNSYNFTFRNISLEGTQKERSVVKGWDANNQFHNVVLDNVSIGGSPVTMANLANYFDVNAFVTGLAVTGYPDYLASVLPVVGSAPGSHGSYFRTSMQAYNPDSTKNYPLRMVFHPAGAPGSSSDVSKQVTVLAGQVLYIPDLLPVMGVASGLGSLDVYYAVGETRKLVTTFRVYNDGGAAGTSGFNEDLVPLNKVFVSGATLLLTCPPNPAKSRLNVGVRTLGDGATIVATLRGATGSTIKSVTKTYGANYFEQTTLDAFLGGASVSGNESLTLQITAGQAVIYGATVDNTTNDSSASLAQRQ
jgi:hypothetical protein